jgi:hypothetical protein
VKTYVCVIVEGDVKFAMRSLYSCQKVAEKVRVNIIKCYSQIKLLKRTECLVTVATVVGFIILTASDAGI